jgi:hypothetical protein
MQNDSLALIGAVIQILLLCIQIPTLIALIVYVVKTWEMASATRRSAEIAESTLREMRDARDQEVAPYVIVYFDVNMSKNFIYLVIKNIGKTMATNIQVSFDPDLQGRKFKQYTKHFLVDKTIPSIPPGHEIRAIFDPLLDYLGSKSPLTYSAVITYFGGLTQNERVAQYVLDLTPYKGIMFAKDYDLADVTKALESIAEHQAELIAEIKNLSTVLVEKQKREQAPSPNLPETASSQMTPDDIADANEQTDAS